MQYLKCHATLLVLTYALLYTGSQQSSCYQLATKRGVQEPLKKVLLCTQSNASSADLIECREVNFAVLEPNGGRSVELPEVLTVKDNPLRTTAVPCQKDLGRFIH